jgi:hypothetical protein
MADLWLLNKWSAGSANDNENKHLWLLGASQYIDQLNILLARSEYSLNYIDIEKFNNDETNNLAEILNKNKSDKANNHNYHILYSYILGKHFNKNDNLNVLEIGLGTNNPTLVSSMGAEGRPGASLYSWKEYLPNSQIFGADIDKDILFNEDRIKTDYVDQLNLKTFDDMQNNFGNNMYDLIIDDGLHSIGANLNTLIYAMSHIKDNGWIVIEDIHIISNWSIINFILSKNSNFKTYIVKANNSWLFALQKLKTTFSFSTVSSS